MSRVKIGDRVEVYGGDGSGPPRYGVYEADVTVHFAISPDGDLLSAKNAEEPIPDDQLPAGSAKGSLPGNPKLRMDDGSVCYGCQVWWGPAKEESTAEV